MKRHEARKHRGSAVKVERKRPARFQAKVWRFVRRAAREIAPSLVFSASLFFHMLLGAAFLRVIWFPETPRIQDTVIRIEFARPRPPKKKKEPQKKREKRDIALSKEKAKPKEDIPPVTRPVEQPKPEIKPEEAVVFKEESPVIKVERSGEAEKQPETVLGLGKGVKIGPDRAKPDIFAGRSGAGKRVILQRGDASEASENAVRMGLEWLKKHQNLNGSWSAWRFEEMCPPGKKCGGAGTDAWNYEPALTGLALLCFLGAGHTHKAPGEYQKSVEKGLAYLHRAQKPDGGFGQKHEYLMYNHAIATLALAEAFAMTNDETLRKPLVKAVNFIAMTQQPGGGWDYTERKTNRNDSSITGWVVMAMKSAAAGGIDIPWQTIMGAIQHFDRMTEATGEVLYADVDPGKGRKYCGMVAVGMLCREFLGWPPSDPMFQKQAALLLKSLPSWQALTTTNFNNMYYWYYASLALYQFGGVSWKTWNKHLRDMLCEHQRRDGHANGSWDPDGKWLGRTGGRVYSTTMGILCLEVYYRYLRLHEDGVEGIDAGRVLVKAFKEGSRKQRIRALKLLSQFGAAVQSRLLVKALDDNDPFVQLYAAGELLQQGNTAGLPVIATLLEHPNDFIRAKAVALLMNVDDPIVVRGLAKALLDEHAFVAEKAALCLVKITGQDFGFSSSSTPEEKKRVAERYLRWLDGGPKERRPEPKTSREKGKILKGLVLAVRPELGIAIIDLGRGMGVKPFDRFTVYRNDKVVGVIEIKDIVDDDMSSARIVKEFTQGAVLRGDKVIQRPE